MLSLLIAVSTCFAAGLDDPSPFGVVCPWPGIGETGVRWVRCGAGATQLVDWGHVEPEPGTFAWDAADGELERDKAEGLTPLPILAYTAPWASSGPDGDRGYPPKDFRHYARFVRESVARYRDDITYWEIWNEQNISFFKGKIADYVDMLKIASIAAHQADPEARIVFGGTAGVDSEYIQRCYDLGAADYFDVMAVHPYQWGATFNDGWNREKIEGLRSLMDRWGDAGKPIWLTEIGWSTSEVSDDDQARLLVQSYVSNLAMNHIGVAKVFWFSVKDWGGPGHGLFADDSARKPSFSAYQTMTRELADTIHWLRLDGTGDVRCYAFADRAGEKAVLVFWSPTPEAMGFEVPDLPGRLTLVDLHGNEQPIDGGDVVTLKATPEPQYLRLPAGALGSPNPSVYWQAPEIPAPREWWTSVHIPDDSSRLWMIPGREQKVGVHLWNLSDEKLKLAGVSLELLDEQGKVRSRAATTCDLRDNTRTAVMLTMAPPADMPLGLMPMRVTMSTDIDPDGEPLVYEMPVRIGAGPTVEFLANSHLERSMYLQPDSKCGASESRRFGSEWSYALPVPSECDAEIAVRLGAHQGQAHKLEASPDGETWETLLDGTGGVQEREARVDGLEPGTLYLRVSGTDVQLDEVIVTWVNG